MSKFLGVIVSVILILGGGFYVYENKFKSPQNNEVFEEYHPLESENEESPEETPEVIPAKAYVELPFLSQAPYKIWDPLHEDACEEAAFLMVKYFLEGNKQTVYPIDKGDEDIIAMVAYEEKNGYGLSITLEQLATIVKNIYGMENSRIEKNITIDDIKKEIASGKPVIIGAAGKILPNPHFRNGGPVYHMLVVKGYDEKGFITNDPGTQFGRNFRYTEQDLYNAIHNWNEADIMKGEKAYLVFD